VSYTHLISVIRDLSVIGAVTFLVWRVAYAAGTVAEAQRQRTHVESELLKLVRDFIEAQRETNKHLSVAIEVHAARLNKMEERLASHAAGSR
jgi:ATP-dependent protease Clp ATPase subunit